MASGDTKTNQYLDIAANGSRADLPSDTCCETRTQTLIRGVAERIMDVEEEVEQLENNPDVVDIVATYADLQAYDTSTLTDKDIIRVLEDETHDGESTYYRYSKSSDSWTYVGSIAGGATYTAGDGIDITNNVISNKEVLVLNYSDYNPENDEEPETIFPEWLIEQGVKGGQVVHLMGDPNHDGESVFLNLGEDAVNGGTVYRVINYIYPYLPLYISCDNTAMVEDNITYLTVTLDEGVYSELGNKWDWEITEDDGSYTTLFFPAGKYITSNEVGGLNVNYDNHKAFSFAGGQELNTIANVGANIENVGKVEIDMNMYPSGFGTILTFDITEFDTTSPMDWGGTMEIDSAIESYDFSQASIGDSIEIFVRTPAGLPFSFTPSDPNYVFTFTDSEDNTIETPSVYYDGYDEPTSERVSIKAGELICLKLIDTDTWVISNTVQPAYYLPRSLSTGGPTVVQTSGTSTTNVMSQDATTRLVYKNASFGSEVQIGASANAGSGNSVAIGYAASTSTGMNSIALGYGAKAASKGQFDVSTGSYATSGYNNSKYRLLTGLYDGQANHDAATVAQGNKLMTTAPATTDAGVLGQLWTDTTGMHTYQLTAIDTTDPDNPVYTWTQRW